MPAHRTNSTNANARNASAAPQIPYQEVPNVELKNTTQMLSLSVATQNNMVEAHMNENGWSTTARVCDFFYMNIYEFIGSKTSEDPKNFLDDIKKIFEVIHVTRNDRVELTLYKLNMFLISGTLSERKIGVVIQLLLLMIA